MRARSTGVLSPGLGAAPPSPLAHGRTRIVLLCALALNQFLVAAAGACVATLGSALRTAMGLSGTALPWAVVVYLLVLGGLLLPLRWLCGRIGPFGGPFLVLLAGLWMFVQPSVVIGARLITTPVAFLVLRGVQGAGAAALTAVALVLVARVLPVRGERELARFGWGAVIVAGVFAGLVIGDRLPVGEWHWAFWMNLPLGALSGMTTLGLLRATRARKADSHLRTPAPSHSSPLPDV
ncbi:MFS transporter [Streptomyces sp. NPDC002680]|uniref:MFS transporter n=1 Tax=Streptomyces sp. NPDC002680 TaxID=3364659 RepID=UPI0036A48A97